MADRLNTITTIYKVNTVDVQNATNLLKQAEATTQKLNQSTVATGANMTNAYKGITVSIEDLRAKVLSLKDQIEKSSDPTKIAKLSAQYKELNATLAKTQESVFKTEKAFTSASLGVGQLYSSVKLLLAAGLVKELADAAINMAKLGGQVDGVTRAFNKLPNAALLLAQLRDATKGTVDNLTLMQKALQAQNFGIPIQKLASLLEFATVRAQQTGISVDYLVNSIVTGLGRNSVKILDNLQINIGELQKRVRETGQTTQEVAITMIGESLKKMDAYVETSETKVQRLAASWDNLKQRVSAAASGVLSTAFNSLSPFFNNGSQSADDASKIIKGAPGGKGDTGYILNEIAKLTGLKADISKQIADIGDKTGVRKGGFNPLDAIGLSSVSQNLKDLEKQHTLLSDTIKILQQYKQTMGLLAEPEKEQVGLIEGWRKQIDDLNEAIVKSTDLDKSTNQGRLLQIQELERLISVYSTLGDKTNELTKDEKERRKVIEENLEKERLSLVKTLPKVGAPNLPTNTTAIPNDSEVIFKTWYHQYATFWDKIGDGFDNLGIRINKTNKRTVEDERRAYQRLAQDAMNALGNIITDGIKSQQQQELDSYDTRITKIKEFYDNQIMLAGDNTKLKTKLQEEENKRIKTLEIERSETAKRIALSGITINTALGVAKALASSFFPINIAEAAIVAAEGYAQYQIASSAKYAKGVINLKGPGTETSDEIPAMLSRGESVMTAKETRENMLILSQIRAGTLNDKMLAKIVDKNGGSQAVLNIQPVVDAIKNQVFPDVEEIAGTLYRVMHKSNGSRVLTRSKYGNFK